MMVALTQGGGTALVIESSTNEGSVALLTGGGVAGCVAGGIAASVPFSARDAATGLRTEGLGPAIAACLAQARLTAVDLTALVCGAGPGGFTSLRCAAAIAKGMCSALSIPLYAVSSLDLLAYAADLREGNYVVALSAGRGEWFGSFTRCDVNGEVELAPAALLSGDDLRMLADRHSARLVGPGLDIDAHPRAEAALRCLEHVDEMSPVSLDTWEPTYGRLAEAQVKWEAAHGRPLSA